MSGRSVVHRRGFIVAGAVLFLCLLATVGDYTVYSPRPEKNPPRILLPSAGGPVLFAHRHHTDESGAGLGCADCHHNEDADTATSRALRCRTCHYENPDVVETVCADDATHPRCVGKKCLVCHEGEGCVFCHRIKE